MSRTAASRVGRSAAALGGTLLTLLILGVIAVFILSAFGIARFVPVLSNSMAPDMPTGSLAVTLPLPRDQVTAGDVIVFSAPDGSNRRVIHRVQHVYGEDEAALIREWTPDRAFLLTKGDNNPAADPWVLTLGDGTLWKQTSIVPAAGWPAIWLAEPRTRIIAYMLAGAAVGAWAIIAIWRRDPDSRTANDTNNQNNDQTVDPAGNYTDDEATGTNTLGTPDTPDTPNGLGRVREDELR